MSNINILPPPISTGITTSATIVNFSAGTTSRNLSNVVFSDSNGMSFGLNGSTITGAFRTVGLSAGTESNSNGLFIFSNSNGVSFGMNNRTITASVAAPGGGVGLSAGTQSVSTGTVVFSNSNGISFGMSGSSRVTASYTVPTVPPETPFGISAGTQSVSTGTVVFSNSNGITFGMSGSSRITMSHNGLTTQTNQALEGSNGSFTYRTATFGNSNGVTFYTTNGSMVGSVESQSNQILTMFATSNTTAGTSGTVDARSITFRGRGIASVGVNNGSVIVEVPAGGGAGDGGVFAGVSTAGNTAGSTGTVSTGNFVLVGTGAVSLSQSTGAVGSAATVTINVPVQSTQPVAVSGSNGSFTFSTLSLGSSNGMHFYTTNGSIVGSYTVPGASPVNFSAGTTSNNLGSVVFSNSNGVSFGLNGSTITASVNAGGGTTLNGLNPFGICVEPLTSPVTNYDFYVVPLVAQQAFQFDRLAVAWSVTGATNSSNSFTLSVIAGIYSLNGSTLSLIVSTNDSTNFSASGTVGSYSLYSHARYMTVPWSSTLPAGNYFLGIAQRSSQNAGGQTIARVIASNQTTNWAGFFGVAADLSQMMTFGLGLLGTTTSLVPGSIALSDMQGRNSNPIGRAPLCYLAMSV